MEHPIRDYMTESPHSIGANQPLATAHEMMRAHQIRHLPVLRAGKLVGIVSQRDLYLVETLQDVDPQSVPVEEAMTQDAYCVSPGTSLTRVAGVMAEKKYGCAIVMDHDEVVGVFTAIDALRALSDVTQRPSRRPMRAVREHPRTAPR
jgi:acetoin utilization protein AcuB